ncbi:MAG: ABC transporter substrate-binding protein [Clostridia bacterium]
MFRRGRIVTILLLVAALVLGATALTSGQEQKPKYGGIWKDALAADPPDLDPVMATDTTSAEVGYQIFETLVAIDPDGEIVPLLAESWKASPDGKTFTFKLRKGVYFHKTTEGGKPTANGGREVTAEDWVWTFNYICDPKTNSPRAYFIDMVKGYKEFRDGKAQSISGIKALDKYTLQIETTYAFAPFIAVLSYNTFVVLPKEDVLKWGKDWNFHVVGTGPFKFESWKHDDKLVLSRNENYWMKDKWGNKLPYLDGIEFRIITDATIEWTEYKLGNLYATQVDDPYYPEASKGLKIINGVKTAVNELGTYLERPQLGTYYYGMNQTLPPFKDNKYLRQAFNYAINRQALIDFVLNGRAMPAKGVLPPGMFAYNENLKGYTYDPKMAKDLLVKAGYPKGVQVTLQYNTSQGHKRIAEALQAQFAQVGIKVDLKNVDWGAHLDTCGTQGTVPFFRMGWVVDYPDPDNFLYVLLNSDNFGDPGNYTRYHNPLFDDLTKQARLATDQEVRRKLYQKAEQIVVEDAPWLFIYHYTSHNMLKPFVRGYRLPSFGQYCNKFTEVWLDL